MRLDDNSMMDKIGNIIFFYCITKNMTRIIFYRYTNSIGLLFDGFGKGNYQLFSWDVVNKVPQRFQISSQTFNLDFYIMRNSSIFENTNFICLSLIFA